MKISRKCNKNILGAKYIASYFFMYKILFSGLAYSNNLQIHKIYTVNQIIDSIHFNNRKSLKLDLGDTPNHDSLQVLLSEKGVPLAYSIYFNTSVCATGECLPVEINLYWNITGRYIGFTLPKGEILTKKNHDPFNKDDYEHLHQLLANPQSILGDYSLTELTQPKDTSDNLVDGITSATTQAISDVTVEGAAYTCHTLWHIANGAIARHLAKRAINIMTADIAMNIVKGRNFDDISWLINHINMDNVKYGNVKLQLIKNFNEFDYFMFTQILKVITPEDLNKVMFQNTLTKTFQQTNDSNLKGIIIDKLIGIEKPAYTTLSYFMADLLTLNISLQVKVLDLWEKHHFVSNKITKDMASLMKSDNKFLVKRVKQYIERSKEKQSSP